MTVRRIVPNIASDRPDQCRAFYSEFLGLRLEMDMGWIATYVSPVNPTAQLSIAGARSDAAPTKETPPSIVPVSITVEVDLAEVDRLHREAVTRGYHIAYPLTDEPWSVRCFAVTDPNGLVINIMSHKGLPAEGISGA